MDGIRKFVIKKMDESAGPNFFRLSCIFQISFNVISWHCMLVLEGGACTLDKGKTIYEQYSHIEYTLSKKLMSETMVIITLE